MPSADTFTMSPVVSLLKKWLPDKEIIVDPFARNSLLATHRNDLNPDTAATYHMQAAEFCKHLYDTKIRADAILFDPPYSPRQISELYQNIGLEVTKEDTQNSRLYKSVKDGLALLLKPGGIAISFGWNSSGFGKTRGFVMKEILLCAHGGAHNDTIVVVEQSTVNKEIA